MNRVVQIQDMIRRDGVLNMGRYDDVLTGLGEIEMVYPLDMDTKLTGLLQERCVLTGHGYEKWYTNWT